MFKWTVSTEVEARTTAREIWNIWVDVSNWPQWDEELEWCSLEDSFKTGSQGKLKPKGWFVSTFVITSCEKDKGYSDRTTLPLTSLIFNHSVIPYGHDKVKVRHHVEAKGLLAPLLWLTLGRKLKKKLPLAVAKLASLAEVRTTK